MILTEDEPPFRKIRVMRYWHSDTARLYHNVANIDLINSQITVESDEDAEKDFNENNLVTYPITNGIIDNCSFALDLNDKYIFERDIVAIWFAKKVIGKMGDTPDFQIEHPSDVIMHPQKQYDYFLSPVKFNKGMFYVFDNTGKFTIPVSQIAQPFIQVFGNLHQDKCLIPTPPPQHGTNQHA